MAMDSLTPYNPFENRKSCTPFTQEQLDYMKQLVDQGWSASKIAKEYKLNIDSIRRRIKQNNWSTKKSQRSNALTQDELSQIKKLIDQGVDLKEISNKFDISISAIKRRKYKNHWTVNAKKNKYNFDENYFDEIDSEHKAYWLGFLMADGYILSKRQRKGHVNESQSFGFSINMQDSELFDYFKEDLKAENPVNIYDNYSSQFASINKTGRILLTSQHTVNMLKKWGLVENKTFSTHMPDIKKELIPAFIRGYSDGDGCITIDKNNRISWKFCGTQELLNAFQDFFGTSYKLTQRFPERHNNNWQFGISGWKNVPRCLDIVYKDATVYLKRKYNKYVEIQGKVCAMDTHLRQS